MGKFIILIHKVNQPVKVGMEAMEFTSLPLAIHKVRYTVRKQL
jgi:hypothetical protein